MDGLAAVGGEPLVVLLGMVPQRGKRLEPGGDVLLRHGDGGSLELALTHLPSP